MSDNEQNTAPGGPAETGGQEKQEAPKQSQADQPQPEKPAAEKKAAPAKEAPPPRPAPPKNPVEDQLKSAFGDKVELGYGISDLELKTGPEHLLAVCEFLKRKAKPSHTFLRNLTAVDWKDQDVIEVVYHIAPFPEMATVCIKCRLPRQAPAVDSIFGLWPAADWLEREVFDLFGVDFKGHPDLRRIMLPPEWKGHPLRKDYEHTEPELPCTTPGCTQTS